MRKEISEAEVYPWGYGVAYWNYMRRVAICYPIPINIIVGVSRNVYYWFARGARDKYMEGAYARGYDEGYGSGYLVGTQIIKAQVKDEVVGEILSRVDAELDRLRKDA